MRVKHKDQTLYGFWSYDLCPYMLGGVIEGFTDKGNIIPRGYQGYSFKPIAIIPDDNGKKALDELRVLRAKYDNMAKALKHEYKNAALRNIGLPEIEEK